MSGRFVDLRSDTLSVPTEAMRTAIADAPLGDDQYGEDRLTIEFEQKAADSLARRRRCSSSAGRWATSLPR